MLKYLLNTPKVLHTYDLYLRLNKLINPKNGFHIIKYADKMKQILSILLNVPVEKFEDREFKEKHYIDFNTMTMFHYSDFTAAEQALLLSDSKFSREAKRVDKQLTRNYCLSVRQLLQFFGTEIMRHFFGDKLWILLAFKTNHEKRIIADQRFIVENQVARLHDAIIIHITRPCAPAGQHASESELITLYENKEYDILMENTGSLRQLFNSIKSEVHNNPIFQ